MRSGTVNAGDPFLLRATRPAAESTYAGIVRLVAESEAEASSAPYVRLADRFATVFLVVSVAAAALRLGHSRVTRFGRWRSWSWRHPAR